MIDYHGLRDRFSLNPDLIWLNNCGVSVPPKSSSDEVKIYLDAFSASGVLQNAKPHGQIKRNIQSYFAEFMGGTPSDYALLNNTAEGMTHIAQSLPLKPGEKILLVEREYPSNVYPYLQLKKDGIEIEFIAPGESNAEFHENIEKALAPNVRAMSLSAVDWLTGRKFDLQAIGTILNRAKIFFILDAAQGAGHVPIDVVATQVDAMAFSCWKWLLGPLGSGGLYMRESFLHQLNIRVAGTSSVKNDEIYLPHREDYKNTVERFMLSTAPYMNWVHLEASLRFLRDIGLINVQSRLFLLADMLAEILRNNGFTVLRDDFGDAKTAIVCAKRQGDMQVLYNSLLKSGVMCAYREGYLRFSPHLNVSEKDLDKFAGIIAQNKA